MEIGLIGTEAYHWMLGDDSMDHLADIRDTISDYWDNEFEENAEFTTLSTEIPADVLSLNSLASRKMSADDWMDRNMDDYHSRDSYQILDWVERDGDGWPYGYANFGTAMTTSPHKTGITNVWRFENPDSYFSLLGVSGTVFHELLHNYDVEHEDGGVNNNNNGSFIMSLQNDEGDGCMWKGSRDVRTAWTTTCSESAVENHINNWQ